jgi:hypothetical protein
MARLGRVDWEGDAKSGPRMTKTGPISSMSPRVFVRPARADAVGRDAFGQVRGAGGRPRLL